MIPQEFIDQLIDRLDIVEVVGRYVPLKRSGQNFTACCPFHNEKTPSFSVSPNKQFYHCFGCGAHGNALRFVMEHTGTPFVEAVTQLAQHVGMEVPQDTSYRSREEQQAHRDAHHAAYTLLQSVTHYYRDQLPRTRHAQHYLDQRGVNAASIETFQIGYAAGRAPNTLVQHFSAQHTLLQEQGLILLRERDQQPYDRLRDRLIFPIHDGQGRCVGFGGRSLDDENTPKYLNSPETPLFNKSRLLYGLHLARPHFRPAGCAIVVEGYLDVVMLHQYGIRHAVATLGTALNPDHLKLLFRQTETVVFCFDGDAAGQKAAQRALDHSLGVIEDGQTIRILFLPEDHDPDSFVRTYGASAFQEHIQNAPPLSEVWINRWLAQHPPTHAEARAALWKGAKNDLNLLVQAPLLAKFLREALYDRINQLNRPSQAPASSAKKTTPHRSHTPSRTGRFSSFQRRNPAEIIEETLSLPRPQPSLWRTALDLAMFAPHISSQLPKPGSHLREPEARALHALLTLGSPQLNPLHPTLVTHQAALLASQNRIQLWPSDFDVAAELQGLLDALHAATAKQERLARYTDPKKTS